MISLGCCSLGCCLLCVNLAIVSCQRVLTSAVRIASSATWWDACSVS
jgi:hypothetical protein